MCGSSSARGRAGWSGISVILISICALVAGVGVGAYLGSQLAKRYYYEPEVAQLRNVLAQLRREQTQPPTKDELFLGLVKYLEEVGSAWRTTSESRGSFTRSERYIIITEHRMILPIRYDASAHTMQIDIESRTTSYDAEQPKKDFLGRPLPEQRRVRDMHSDRVTVTLAFQFDKERRRWIPDWENSIVRGVAKHPVFSSRAREWTRPLSDGGVVQGYLHNLLVAYITY